MIMKAKIQYGTITIPYDIIKSKRIKTSEIIVDADKVIIRTSLSKDIFEIICMRLRLIRLSLLYLFQVQGYYTSLANYQHAVCYIS